MWFSDYLKAIQGMDKAVGHQCWADITCSWNGDRVIFITSSDWHYVYYCKTGRIEKHFRDTWRHPEHMEIIVEGE